MFVFRPLTPSVIPLLCQRALKCALSTFLCRFQQNGQVKHCESTSVRRGEPALVSTTPNEQEMWIWLPIVLRDVELKWYTEGSVKGAGRRWRGLDGIQKNSEEVREWLRCCAVDKWGVRRACCSWQLLWAALGLSYSLEGKVCVGENVLDVWWRFNSVNLEWNLSVRHMSVFKHVCTHTAM